MHTSVWAFTVGETIINARQDWFSPQLPHSGLLLSMTVDLTCFYPLVRSTLPFFNLVLYPSVLHLYQYCSIVMPVPSPTSKAKQHFYQELRNHALDVKKQPILPEKTRVYPAPFRSTSLPAQVVRWLPGPATKAGSGSPAYPHITHDRLFRSLVSWGHTRDSKQTAISLTGGGRQCLDPQCATLVLSMARRLLQALQGCTDDLGPCPRLQMTGRVRPREGTALLQTSTTALPGAQISASFHL